MASPIHSMPGTAEVFSKGSTRRVEESALVPAAATAAGRDCAVAQTPATTTSTATTTARPGRIKVPRLYLPRLAPKPAAAACKGALGNDFGNLARRQAV